MGTGRSGYIHLTFAERLTRFTGFPVVSRGDRERGWIREWSHGRSRTNPDKTGAFFSF
jgi:hypothetical protein